MILPIETQPDYDQMCARIELYLVKKSANLTETDFRELRQLSELVEQYEDRHYPMPVKTT